MIKSEKIYISVNLMKAIINIIKNGFHIFKSVFDKKFVSTLSDIIKKQKPSPQAGFFNNKKLDSKSVLNLLSKDKIFHKLLNHKLITKINTFFFNDKCYKSIDSKLNEKSEIVQRGNLRSASNFISKGIY